MGERRVLKNPFSRWVTVRYSRVPGRASLRLALALLKMGKKSRRPARQDKRTEKKPTLDTLDDDTAKPSKPLSAESAHASTYLQVNYKDNGIHSSQINTMEFREGVRASWRALRRKMIRPVPGTILCCGSILPA